MSQTTNSDSADALNDRLESVHSLLSDRDDGELSEEDASNLREHVERISEASFEEMFAAAGFDGDDLGPGDVPRLLSKGSSEEVQTLRQLLDVSKLGEDAPANDEELADQLDGIFGDPGETAGDEDVDDADDGQDADLGENDTSEVDPAEADADTGGDESSDGGDEVETEEGETSDESGETDDAVTFADVFSGAASLAKDWSSSGDSAADEEDDADADETVDDADDVGDEEAADEEAADGEEDDDSLFDTEDIKERLTGDDEDESSDSDGKRRSRRRRFSTVPSRRSDMGKSPRFSTVKARK